MSKKIILVLFLVLSCFALKVNPEHKDDKIGKGAAIASSIGASVDILSILWDNYCVVRERCKSRMACGRRENKDCVQGFCTGSSQCPRKYYCNDQQVFGKDGLTGVCIRNSKLGPILQGGSKICTGSSQCQKGYYCNDEQIWGYDGKQGNCKK